MSPKNTYISPSQKCLTNIELITNICKFLNYKEQYQLLQTSRDLKNIMINYVWKTRFKEMGILINKTNDIVITDTIYTFIESYDTYKSDLSSMVQRNNLLLKKYEMKNFLNLNKNNIKTLQIRAVTKNKPFKLKCPIKPTFKNLTSICYYRLTLTNEDLKKVAENCEQLENLILLENLNQNCKRLVLDKDIDIRTIKSMPNLKRLTIKDNMTDNYSNLGGHKFSNIKNMLNQLNLEYLILNVNILPNKFKKNNELNLTNLKTFKELVLGSFIESSDFLYFQTHLLPHFENLCNLSLCSVTITKEFLNILLKSCKNLTHLTFDHCTIEDFIALPKLEEINLLTCFNLTDSCMKIILNEIHLKSFKATSTDWDVDNFSITPSLKTFEHSYFRNNNLLRLFEFNSENLRNLTKFRWFMFLDYIKDYDFSLSKLFPNLVVLYTHHLHFNIEDWFNLKYLQKIFINSVRHLTVSKLRKLLMLNNLKELSFGHHDVCNMDIELSQIEAFETKLIYLCIPWSVMKIIPDFILDLLQRNRNLSLICQDIEIDSIIQLSKNVKFQNHFKSINICGFSIDCIAIQNECVATMDLIKLIMTISNKFKGNCYFVL